MAAISHNQFLAMAREVAKSSNCVSMGVGALIVVNNRIRVTGYNGTPAGYFNCRELHMERGVEHTKWSLDHEIHAEMNALMYAAAEGLSVKGGIVYCTHEPCKNCIKHMIGAQLSGVVFGESYYNEFIEDKNIKYEFAQATNFKILQNVNGLTVEWFPQQSV